jgi:hypothetical protein
MIDRNRLAALVAAIALLFALTCCRTACDVSDVRFWEATVPESGAKYYTVDTEAHPLGSWQKARFLSPEQKIFHLESYTLKAISGAHYVMATNGGKWRVVGGEYNRPPCRAYPLALGTVE